MKEIIEFEKELNTLGESLPVSASKINHLTKIALDNVTNHKQIIRLIAAYALNCPPEAKLPAVYLIDSICRQSQKLSLTVYQSDFEKEFPQMFKELSKCIDNDKDKIIKVVGFWISSNLLSSGVLSEIYNYLTGSKNPENNVGLSSLISNLKGDSSIQKSQIPGNIIRSPIGRGNEPTSSTNVNPESHGILQQQPTSNFNHNLNFLQQNLQSMAGNAGSPNLTSHSFPQQNLLTNLQSLTNNGGNAGQNNLLASLQAMANNSGQQFSNNQQNNSYNYQKTDSSLNQSFPFQPGMNNLMQSMSNSNYAPQQNMNPNANFNMNINPLGGGIDNQPFLNLAALITGNQMPGMNAQQLPLGNLINMLSPNLTSALHMNNVDPRRSDPRFNDSRNFDNERSNDRNRQRDVDRRDNQRKRSIQNRQNPKLPTISKDKPVGPGPDCVASHSDPSVPSDCIKFMSRTLFISDLASNFTAVQLRELLEKHARIETVRLNTSKGQAFVKVATRKEAETLRNVLGNYRMGNHVLKIGWGCGYGPREHFNYTDGYTMFPISKIPEKDKSVIESCPPRGGGPIIGGTIAEEPNVPIEIALQSRGSALAPRQGLQMPPRIEQKYKRQLGEKREAEEDNENQKKLKYDD